MNRLALVLLRNLTRLPGLYGKLCHYAKHTDKYPEAEKYAHIQKVLTQCTGASNRHNSRALSNHHIFQCHCGLSSLFVPTNSHCQKTRGRPFLITRLVCLD